MIFIHIIIAFLLGIVFIQWIVPFIDGLLGLILTQFEVWKGKMAVKISKSQEEISKKPEEPLSQIGFMISEDKEEEEFLND